MQSPVPKGHSPGYHHSINGPASKVNLQRPSDTRCCAKALDLWSTLRLTNTVHKEPKAHIPG